MEPKLSASKTRVPMTHEILFPESSSHVRGISAMALDKHTGTQLLTGSDGDYMLKLWDMESMSSSLRPFKQMKPFDGHPVRALSFSPDQNASMFLCCCGNNQARVYKSDGSKYKLTIRGDMYIQDMANTKGHVASITGGQWHPKSAQEFITCSLDGSVRIWDVEGKLHGLEQNLPHKQILKAKDARGLKVGISACAYTHKGELVLAGCLDGSIQVWDTRASSFYRPQILIQKAHDPNQGDITCLKPLRTNGPNQFLTRSIQTENQVMESDQAASMKLWDLRMNKDTGGMGGKP